MVNYAAILPHTGSLGCWPQVPIAFSDVSWLRSKQVEPLVPVNTAAPFHPNLNGMTGIAAVVAAEVGP